MTGTENVMMAATLADGETVIRNAAREPEIVDLAELLGEDGRAHPGGGRAHHPRSKGVDAAAAAPSTRSSPTASRPGTYVAACAIAGGDIEIRNCQPAHLRP